MTASESHLFASINGYRNIDDFNFNESKDWLERRMKGRMGEILVEEMFKSLGFKTIPSGMENSFPHLMGDLKGKSDKISHEIRKTPDLLVYDPRTDKNFYIDVKFRADGRMTKDRLDNNPHDGAYILLISPYHIKCALVEEIKAGKSLTKGRSNFLGDRKEFQFETKHKRIIHRYRQMASNVFCKIPFTSS